MMNAKPLTVRYYVYTLAGEKDGKLYTGRAIDLHRRIREHRRGEIASTRRRGPLKLVHYGYFTDKDAAVGEKFLKSGHGRDNLKQALKGTLKGQS